MDDKTVTRRRDRTQILLRARKDRKLRNVMSVHILSRKSESNKKKRPGVRIKVKTGSPLASMPKIIYLFIYGSPFYLTFILSSISSKGD